MKLLQHTTLPPSAAISATSARPASDLAGTSLSAYMASRSISVGVAEPIWGSR